MNILLAVSGSISCYKSLDLMRNLIQNGHQVKVVLTKGAIKFLRPELFHYLGAQKTYGPDDDFKTSLGNNITHISLANWCDKLVICPASAHTVSRLAYGHADDLLSSLFLALNGKEILIFPAMNTNMLHHPLTKKNISTLQEMANISIIPPDDGILACGEEGEGKLPQIDEIEPLIECLSPTANNRPNRKKILISTGATISPIDPVRFLTNPSSGLTGFYLAKEFMSLGHHVHVIAGKFSSAKLDLLLKHPRYALDRVTTTDEMAKKVSSLFLNSDIYISSAAINDMAFNTQVNKVKKSQLSSVKILPTKDILSEVISQKNHGQKLVGFAAETGHDQELFLSKWHKKPVDLLIGNFVESGLNQNQQKKGFGATSNQYFFIENGKILKHLKLDKKQLAHEISKAIL